MALALASAAWAADENKILDPAGAAPAGTPGSGSMGGVSLALGLALAAVGGWLVWRGRRNPSGPRGGQSLTIEETRSLGNRQYLVVASYENKKFLLGVCPGRIDHLAPLHEERPHA
jgi:flagellar protein FliO/FliZ